jgi:multidrug efflux pump subunit AcrA (membrane-fusion protein)
MTRVKLAALLLVAVPLIASACGGGGARDDTTAPAVVEHVKGSKLERVRLSAEAAKRIGIRTVPVRKIGGGRLVIPYGALLYDPNGKTWTYTNPTPLVFQRHDVAVERIEGQAVLLRSGPPPGTRVVTQGATELWGVEYGGIKED